jgi:hypothetical protein
MMIEATDKICNIAPLATIRKLGAGDPFGQSNVLLCDEWRQFSQ